MIDSFSSILPRRGPRVLGVPRGHVARAQCYDPRLGGCCGRYNGPAGHVSGAAYTRDRAREAPAARSADGAGARHSRAVRDRVRERRLLDLLRARAHGGLRARADAPRLPHRRDRVRGDCGDVRRGNRPLPGGRRLVELRTPRVQRARELRRRVGPDARLRRDDRDLGVLRAALPLDLLGAARTPIPGTSSEAPS